MINLINTSSKAYVVTSAAGDIEVFAAWVDLNGTTVTPSSQHTASITTASAGTDVVPAPGASTVRNVKYVSIHNHHASVVNTVEFYTTDGTNAVEHKLATLAPGETLQYIEGAGWQHSNSSGVPITAGPYGPVDVQTFTPSGCGASAACSARFPLNRWPRNGQPARP